MKPGCTCLSHKEGLIIGNGSKKIKNAHVLPREPFLKGCCMWFSLFKWASRSSALSIWSYSHWPILQEFCTEESESFTIRNDQAKDGQESTFYMTTPPLMRLLSRFLKGVPVISFYFQGLRKCFLEVSIHLEVLLAALLISVSNRYQNKTIYLLFVIG